MIVFSICSNFIWCYGSGLTPPCSCMCVATKQASVTMDITLMKSNAALKEEVGRRWIATLHLLDKLKRLKKTHILSYQLNSCWYLLTFFLMSLYLVRKSLEINISFPRETWPRRHAVSGTKSNLTSEQSKNKTSQSKNAIQGPAYE